MGIFITIWLLAVLIIIAYDYHRSARVRYLELTERFRIRFSRIRHRLVLLAGSEEMSGNDRKAFEFLYHETTLLLRYPTLYRQLSMSACLMDRTLATPLPSISKEDFSDRTRPLLKECVEASRELIQKFPPPAFVLVAILSWKRVWEWSHNIERWLKELEAARKRVEAWVQISARLL
ncbi:MAG: hypothetical protein ACREV3_06095 [Gammaproteobacteria bacterium]